MTEADEKMFAALIGVGATFAVALVSAVLGFRNQSRLDEVRAEQTRELEAFKITQLERLEAVKAAQSEKLDTLKARHSEQLEEMKAALSERANAASARRDYEYEARKRLYSDLEPLLFQLHEALVEAASRVQSLARSACDDRLGIGPRSWVEREGYYLRSTMYKLFLPVAFLRIMQRGLTFVDFGLDASIHLRYRLLKLHFLSFTDDFAFAKLDQPITYSPNDPASAQERAAASAVYHRQGVVIGDLENIGDLLVRSDNGVQRVISFGEFEQLLREKKTDDDLAELRRLFAGFSPTSRPVLARMLHAQACLGQLHIAVYGQASPARDLCAELDAIVSDPTFRQSLSWSKDAPEADLRPAVAYLSPRLTRIRDEVFGKLSANAAHPSA